MLYDLPTYVLDISSRYKYSLIKNKYDWQTI